MITLISTPAYEPLDPTIICRWLATESPNNFRLLRQDWIITNLSQNGSFLAIEVDHNYTPVAGNNITVVDISGNVYTGTITTVTDPTNLITSILWASVIDTPSYMNDNTLHGGYYFEGRLTVNGVLYPLTIIASPDSLGYADLDVSGILRIVTSLGKVGDYTSRITKEYTKSGNFFLEYRECWYGSNEAWEGDIITSPITSPPIFNIWYYGECVRSEEQGSNLHDYIASSVNDAPFLNQFDTPVYFLGLPFDLSFILPEMPNVSPTSDITVTICIYDSVNKLLNPDPTFTFTTQETIPADQLEGYICSLNINLTAIYSGAAYLTAEITV